MFVTGMVDPEGSNWRIKVELVYPMRRFVNEKQRIKVANRHADHGYQDVTCIFLKLS